MRYITGTRAQLELIVIALDKANGLRDAAGNATPRAGRTFRGGVEVTGTIYDPNVYGVFQGMHPGHGTEIIEGDDGTCVLCIPELAPMVDRHLGKRLDGVSIPRASDLVDETKAPPRVRAELQRRKAVRELDEAIGLAPKERPI